MNKVVGLLFVSGLLAVTIYLCWSADKTIEEAEEFLATLPEEEEVEMIPIKEEAEKDIVEKFEPVAEEVATAPYDFLTLAEGYQIYLEQRCADLEMNFWLVASIMFSESSFNPEAVGDSGRSIGLMQINKCWWNFMAEEYGLVVTEPYDNIEAGLIILKALMEDYPDDVAAVIQCYKCGRSRGAELMEKGIYLDCIETIVNRAIEWEEMK